MHRIGNELEIITFKTGWNYKKESNEKLGK